MTELVMIEFLNRSISPIFRDPHSFRYLSIMEIGSDLLGPLANFSSFPKILTFDLIFEDFAATIITSTCPKSSCQQIVIPQIRLSCQQKVPQIGLTMEKASKLTVSSEDTIDM